MFRKLSAFAWEEKNVYSSILPILDAFQCSVVGWLLNQKLIFLWLSRSPMVYNLTMKFVLTEMNTEMDTFGLVLGPL